MDALRESLARNARSAKKQPKSEKELHSRKIGLVKTHATTHPSANRHEIHSGRMTRYREASSCRG
jgi:hypothetical protein